MPVDAGIVAEVPEALYEGLASNDASAEIRKHHHDSSATKLPRESGRPVSQLSFTSCRAASTLASCSEKSAIRSSPHWAGNIALLLFCVGLLQMIARVGHGKGAAGL